MELSRLSAGMWVLSRIYQGQKLYINLLKILEGCKVSRWKACGWFVQCCIAVLLNVNVTPPSKNTLEASLSGLMYWCCCLHRCFIFSRFLEGLHYWIAGTCKIWGSQVKKNGKKKQNDLICRKTGCHVHAAHCPKMHDCNTCRLDNLSSRRSRVMLPPIQFLVFMKVRSFIWFC